jgi:hypothetical protein
MRKLAAASLIAAALARPCSADLIADVAVSTASASPRRRSSAGTGAGLKEGKPLEVMLWGGGGAIAGSLAGPLGTIVGAGTGALCGLLYSVFIVPRNGPDPL